MIYGITDNKLDISIESYANKLVWYLHWYLNKTEDRSLGISKKATEKAKIVLLWMIFPNEREFEKDFNYIKDDIGPKTNRIIRSYTRCIMQLLGQVAECVIVDRCCSNADTNKICMNIALFRENVYNYYADIPYDEYLAFSTSFKFVIYKDEVTGLYMQYNVPDYNPNHTLKDIAWCKKDNILTQLKVDIPELQYMDNARLQIKTTLDSSNIVLDSYFNTPVICFDLCHDIEKLRRKYPKHILFSAGEISPEMENEVEKYFHILGAYATGLINHINITDIEVQQDLQLAQLFRTPVMNIIKERELNKAGVIALAEDVQKPIVVAG